MATRIVSTKFAVEGESQYKQSLQGINSALSALNTEVKLVESQYKNHQNTIEALRAKQEALAKVQTTLKEKVETCRAGFDNAKSALEKYQAKIADLNSALEKNKTALDGMDDATRQSGEQWAAYKTKIEQAEERLKVLQNTAGDTGEEEEKLRREIDQAKDAMAQLENQTGGTAKTAGELVLEQRSLTEELGKAEAGQTAATRACENWEKQQNKAQIALNETNADLELNERYLKEAEEASDGCAKSIDEFGNKTKEASTSTADLYNALAGAGLIQAIKKVGEAFMACVDAAAEFEAQMSTVEAISGATQSEMQELSALAKEMGATTKFTATEAGEGLEYMAMAGWKADDMLDGLEGIMDLAAAAGENLGTTSDIVTDALTAFGLSAKDSAHFSDVLAQASANSNTNVSMLGQSFKMVATTAGSLNYSVDDVAVALGAMANQGLKSEMAGTALATAFTRMAGTNETAANAMDQLGLSMFDSQGNAKDLATFMGELRDAFSGLNQQQTVSYAYMLAGQKGMKGLQAIVNTSEKDWNKLTEAIAGSSGAASIMAQTKLDNYAGQVTLLQSAFDGLKTEVGSVLTPALGELAEVATGALGWMTDVVREHPGVVAAITGVVMALGALAAIMAVIAFTQIPAVTAAISGLWAVITAHPIGALVTALGALVVGIGTAIGVAKAHAEAQKVQTHAAEALSEVLEDQRAEYDELTEANKETAKSTRDLAETVISLSASARTSAADHDALLNMVERLNEEVPGLNLAYNEATGALNMTTDAIRAQVEAQNGLSEAQAAQERYNELLLNQTSIEQDIAENQERHNEAQQRYNELLDGSPLAYFSSEASECRQIMSDTSEAIDILNGELEENGNELATLEGQVNAYNAAQGQAAGMSDQAANMAKNLAGTLVELRTAYDEAYDSALDSIKGQTSAWEKLDETVAMSSGDITEALESQIEYWENYTSNIDNLTGRNIEGIDRLVAAYDGNAAAIAGLANMSDAEITATIARLDALGEAEITAAKHTADAVTNYSSSAQEMVNKCKETLADPSNSEAMMQAALEMLEGFAMGIDQSGEEVDEATQRAAQEVIDTWKTVHDSHSPSRVFEQLAVDDMTGYINGVNGQEGNTTTTLQSIAKKAIAAFKGEANSGSLNEAGSGTIGGYISGVDGQRGSMTSKMRAMASDAVRTFQGGSTTSSLQGTGGNTIQGYINGLASKESDTTAKMRAMAAEAISTYTSNATSSSLYSAGGNTIQGFINGLAAKASSLYSKLRSIASSAMESFRKTLGINSPSTEFASDGGNSIEGYIIGIDRKKQNVIQAMKNIAQTASGAFNTSLAYDIGTFTAGDTARRAAEQQEQQMVNLRLEVPIYINGQYTKREIVEIAKEGIGRRMMNLNAAKGVFA